MTFPISRSLSESRHGGSGGSAGRDSRCGWTRTRHGTVRGQAPDTWRQKAHCMRSPVELDDVGFLDVPATGVQIGEQERAAVERVMASGMLAQGSEVARFE